MPLSHCRQHIDAIDTQLVALLEKRLAIAQEVAAIKKVHHLPIYDATREQQLLQRIGDMPQDRAYAPYIQAIYEQILATSKQWQSDCEHLSTCDDESSTDA